MLGSMARQRRRLSSIGSAFSPPRRSVRAAAFHSAFGSTWSSVSSQPRVRQYSQPPAARASTSARAEAGTSIRWLRGGGLVARLLDQVRQAPAGSGREIPLEGGQFLALGFAD